MAKKEKKEKEKPHKVDGIIYEREVHSGPLGDGYSDFQYRLQGNKLQYKVKHFSLEDRPDVLDWTEIEDLPNGTKHPYKIALGG
jgi:hypothetical protein